MTQWELIRGCIPCNFKCWCCNQFFYRCQNGDPLYKKKSIWNNYNNNRDNDIYVCGPCTNCDRLGECMQIRQKEEEREYEEASKRYFKRKYKFQKKVKRRRKNYIRKNHRGRIILKRKKLFV
jgi:hypothetical protein